VVLYPAAWNDQAPALKYPDSELQRRTRSPTFWEQLESRSRLLTAARHVLERVPGEELLAEWRAGRPPHGYRVEQTDTVDNVLAMQAIFRAFRGTEKLSFDGDHYSFSLLPGMWSPGPIDVDDPPIYVSAVLPWMSRMAGAVCDGVHIHPMHSPGWLVDVQVPLIAEGAASESRTLDDVTLVCPVIIAVGDSDEEIHAMRERNRATIAFYGSTPNYAPVLEHHGFDGLQGGLNSLQRTGDLAGMVDLVTDDVLDHYTVSARWADLGGVLADRYRGVAPNLRVMTYTALDHWRRDPNLLDRWSDVVRDLRDSD